MSQIFGRLVICDRCGEKIFNKSIKHNKFEKLPKGWGCIDSISYKMLCPKCSEEYKKVNNKFIEEVKK